MKRLKTKTEKELAKRVSLLEKELMGIATKKKEVNAKKYQKAKESREKIEKEELKEKNHERIVAFLKDFEKDWENGEYPNMYLLSKDLELRKAVILNREFLSYPTQTKHPLGFGLVDTQKEGYVCAAYLIDWNSKQESCDSLEQFLIITPGSVIHVTNAHELESALIDLCTKQKDYWDRLAALENKGKGK